MSFQFPEELQIRQTSFYRSLKRAYRITGVALQLGATPFQQAKLFLGGFFLLLTNDLNVPVGFTAQLRYLDQAFAFHFEDLGDYGLLHEVFVQEEYHVDLAGEPEVIVDLGSNIGVSILYFRLRYPRARIYGFEPDPENYQRLQQHAHSLKGVQLQNMAVWSSDGQVEFFTDSDWGSSSSIARRERRHSPTIAAAKTLDTILSELQVDQIDLLKFDIEGAEKDVFESFTGLEKVTELVGEVHLDIGDIDLQDFLRLFEETHVVCTHQLTPLRYLMTAHDAGALEAARD